MTVSVLLTYFAANRALHQLWTAAVGTPGYNKSTWRTVANGLDKLARDAATAVGYPVDQPLIEPAESGPGSDIEVPYRDPNTRAIVKSVIRTLLMGLYGPDTIADILKSCEDRNGDDGANPQFFIDWIRDHIGEGSP